MGLRVVEQFDTSRVFGHARARPLQTLIWYPAGSNASSSMTVGDYMNLWRTETSFDRPKRSARAREWLAAISPALGMPLRAIRDAEALVGSFPVVIYAPSFSSVSWENADLCEYLASHGFVVIASASLGANSRNMTADLAGANAQARDISFLIGYARTLAHADPCRVAVAGFSWGGLSNLFAAARDNRIRALIALDGSIRYWPGLVRQAEDVQPKRMTIPLLSFAKAEWTFEEQARYLSAEQMSGPNVLNAWTHGDLFSVHMLGMTHREFSAMFQRNEDVWKDFHDPQFPDRQKADYGREVGMTGYGWVARYTLEFLDAYLKEDAEARAYLERPPAQNGVPARFMEVSYRAATGVPPTFDAFRAAIGREGFGRAADCYAHMLKEHPDLELDENAVHDWAEELLDEDCFDEAIALLSLNVRMYPDSSGAHASLARARQLAGQIPAAIEGYRQALAGNRINPEARRRLRELEGAPAASGGQRDAG